MVPVNIQWCAATWNLLGFWKFHSSRSQDDLKDLNLFWYVLVGWTNQLKCAEVKLVTQMLTYFHCIPQCQPRLHQKHTRELRSQRGLKWQDNAVLMGEKAAQLAVIGDHLWEGYRATSILERDQLQMEETIYIHIYLIIIWWDIIWYNGISVSRPSKYHQKM